MHDELELKPFELDKTPDASVSNTKQQTKSVDDVHFKGTGKCAFCQYETNNATFVTQQPNPKFESSINKASNQFTFSQPYFMSDSKAKEGTVHKITNPKEVRNDLIFFQF